MPESQTSIFTITSKLFLFTSQLSHVWVPCRIAPFDTTWPRPITLFSTQWFHWFMQKVH